MLLQVTVLVSQGPCWFRSMPPPLLVSHGSMHVTRGVSHHCTTCALVPWLHKSHIPCMCDKQSYFKPLYCSALVPWLH